MSSNKLNKEISELHRFVVKGASPRAINEKLTEIMKLIKENNFECKENHKLLLEIIDNLLKKNSNLA